MSGDAAEHDTLPVLDEAAQARLRRIGGGKLLRQMIEMYLGNAPERMAAVQAALEADDASALERAAHSLKSSAGNLGAVRLMGIAARVENAAAAGAVDRELTRRMLSEYTASVHALTEVTEGLTE